MSEEIKKEKSIESRRQLRAALKWALRPIDYRQLEDKDGLKDWFTRKLEGIMAYALADKSEVSNRALELTNDHYARGVPIVALAHHHHISSRQVIRDINSVLDCVLDNAPKEVLASLSPKTFMWHNQPCPHCGGNLFWDDVGAYGGDGEFCCLQCAHRFDYMLQPFEPKIIIVS